MNSKKDCADRAIDAEYDMALAKIRFRSILVLRSPDGKTHHNIAAVDYTDQLQNTVGWTVERVIRKKDW